jgi:hypothetical protein
VVRCIVILPVTLVMYYSKRLKLKSKAVLCNNWRNNKGAIF